MADDRTPASAATPPAAASSTPVAVPDDFPAGIPLLDGTVSSVDQAGIGKQRRQWEVNVLVDGPEDPFYDALDKLRGAGFSAGEEVGVMTRRAQEVHVTSLAKGKRFEISYLVVAPARG